LQGSCVYSFIKGRRGRSARSRPSKTQNVQRDTVHRSPPPPALLELGDRKAQCGDGHPEKKKSPQLSSWKKSTKSLAATLRYPLFFINTQPWFFMRGKGEPLRNRTWTPSWPTAQAAML
jgi:hypothetical protein